MSSIPDVNLSICSASSSNFVRTSPTVSLLFAKESSLSSLNFSRRADVTVAVTKLEKRIAVSIVIRPTNLPIPVIGTTSPYPNPVIVAISYHKASSVLLETRVYAVFDVEEKERTSGENNEENCETINQSRFFKKC